MRRYAAFAAINAAAVVAEIISYCAQGASSVCFQWGIPRGGTDAFFQIRAPTTYQWVALGIGPDMAQSSMFVVYQDGGGNVTLSTRPGQDHAMPTYAPREDVRLLAGSGVVDGSMVANVRCAACSELSLSGSNGWIAAWRTGGSLATKDPDAMLVQHDSHDQFRVDFAAAGIASDDNPFTAPAAGAAGGGGGNETAVVSVGDGVSLKDLRTAHGILMSIVFLVLYPAGSMLMPLLGKWYIHASWQLVSFLIMWAAFVVGYLAAHRQQIFFDFAHTQLGIFVVCLLTLQPILGWTHHVVFLRTHARSLWSWLHIWYGRALMVLGVVAGGLGLRDRAGDLTDEQRRRYSIAYGTVAGVMGLAYLASMAMAHKAKREKQVLA